MSLLKGDLWWGDKGKSKPGTNSISTGTPVPGKLYLWEKKIFLSSKMMNLPPQHINEKELICKKLKINTNLKKNIGPFNLTKKCFSTKEFVIVDQSWLHSKIGPRSRNLIDVQFKFFFPFFLCLSASIPSCVCCFVSLNRYWGNVMYGPGASSWASQGRRTHDPKSPTSQPHPVPP